MFRPTKLLPSWCLTAVMLVLAAWSCGQEPSPPQAARQTLPAAPGDGLLDEGRVFSPAEQVLVAAEIEDFRHRAGLPAFVVTINYVFGETLDVYGERLVTAWANGKSAVVLLYERGSGKLNYSATPGALGGGAEEMQALFLAASRAAATMPEEATAGQRLRAALHGLTLAAETWKQTGTLPVPDAPPAPGTPAPDAPAGEEVPPPAPVDFVIDDAEAFDDAMEAALKTALVTFHNQFDLPIYVAAYTILPEMSAALWAERLAREWLQGRPGVVLVMNRGTGPDESPVGIAGTAHNEQVLTSAALFKIIEQARLKARDLEAAPGGSPATGLLGAAQHLMQALPGSIHAGAPPGSSGVGRIITWMAAALVTGSALLFMFHRLQERIERRSNEQWLFPDVSVGCRLGATRGGGVVAGISFDRQPPP